MSDLQRDAPWRVFGLQVFGVNMNLCRCLRDLYDSFPLNEVEEDSKWHPVTAHLPSKDMENMMFNIWLHSNQLRQLSCKKRRKGEKRTTWSRLQHKVALIMPSSFHGVAEGSHLLASSIRPRRESAIWQQEQNRGFLWDEETTRCFRRWQDYKSEKFS